MGGTTSPLMRVPAPMPPDTMPAANPRLLMENQADPRAMAGTESGTIAQPRQQAHGEGKPETFRETGQ